MAGAGRQVAWLHYWRCANVQSKVQVMSFGSRALDITLWVLVAIQKVGITECGLSRKCQLPPCSASTEQVGGIAVFIDAS